MKSKQDIRSEIKSAFKDFSGEKKAKQNLSVFKQVQDFMSSKNAQRICIYESMSDEADTSEIIHYLKGEGHKIYTPQIIGETQMILIDSEYEVYEKEIDIFIVPARALTQDGKRLGRGRGYYDRFLAQKIYKKSFKLGICYDFQIYKTIPTNQFDIPVNTIISYEN